MIALCRLPTLCAIIILGLSLAYLSIFRPSILQSRLDTDLWHDISNSLQAPQNQTRGKIHNVSQHHASTTLGTTTSTSLLSSYTSSHAAAATMSKPSGHHSSLAMDSADSGCSVVKPNLIVSAIDGPKLQDQIFIFMQSLDVAIGKEYLTTQRTKLCPPAPVQVHILVPTTFMEEIPPAFKALMQRYPSLDFVPALPDVPGANIVLIRFKGWSEYLKPISDQYDKVLASDLDVVFQRNPFTMPLDSGVELLYFAEWRGLKIGQCSVHVRWFSGCAGAGAIPHDVSATYMPLERICAGSIYGTATAMQVYLDVMADQLSFSSWGCNDQAMHIHIYYSGLLDEELEAKGLGKAHLMPNHEALLGTVGTTPLVRFNEWGEILNENGQVQHAIHQFKTHARLSDIIWRRYGWVAPVGVNEAIPPSPELIEEATTQSSKAEPNGEKHAYHKPQDKALAELDKTDLKRYILANVTGESCNAEGLLCSCRHHDCQLHYEWF